MDVKASVDVGPNITSLIERLAQQIGTTADKVFPWYVQQAYVEGVTALCALGAFFLLALVLFLVGIRKADFDKGNRYAVMCSAGIILAVVVMLPAAFEGTEAVRKILNPNYYAMKSLTIHVAKLAGR